MWYQHPSTKHRALVRRTDYDERARLVRDGYVDVTKPHSPLKIANQKRFQQLGTITRTFVNLNQISSDCADKLTPTQHKKLSEAAGVLLYLTGVIRANMNGPKAKSKQTPEGG